MGLLAIMIVLANASCTMIGTPELEPTSPEITNNHAELGEVRAGDTVTSLEDRRRELEAPTSSELSMSIRDAGVLNGR